MISWSESAWWDCRRPMQQCGQEGSVDSIALVVQVRRDISEKGYVIPQLGVRHRGSAAAQTSGHGT
jgi:hypothetical protein